MNTITLSNCTMPIVSYCGFCTALEDFYHIDRIADFNVLIYVTKGAIHVTETLTPNGEQEEVDYQVNSGEVLFLKKGIRHFGKTPIEKGVQWYFAHFTLEFSSDLVDNQVEIPKKSYFPVGGNLENLLISLCDSHTSEDEKKRWLSNKLLFESPSLIAFWENSEKEPDLGDNLVNFIRLNCDKKFSSRLIEEKFFLSYKHLAAIFKKKTGQTMQEYHNKVRMNLACKLLSTTLLTVGEISDRCGFADMLYFSRTFHKSIGVSPTEYRRNVVNIY